MTNTDRAWEYFGRETPYYGVLTDPQFSPAKIDRRAKEAFFRSGEDYVEMVLQTVHDSLDPDWRASRALDFGCGVGRLTLPLARRCESVVGVDVSESMLAEAKTNAASATLTNVQFVKGDDHLSRVKGDFDLVHAFIVFQHIPPTRGELILRHLLEHLRLGGVGIIHMTYANSTSTPHWRRWLTKGYERVPYLQQLRNLAKHQTLGPPPMQMNLYDLNRIFRILQEVGSHDIHVRFTEASHYRFPIYGVTLYFSKRALDVTLHS